MDASLHSSISVPKSVAAYNQFVVIKLLFICVPRAKGAVQGCSSRFPVPYTSLAHLESGSRLFADPRACDWHLAMKILSKS